MEVSSYDSSDSNVSKYVFEFDDAVAEAVLYKYGSFKERTVLCVSTQSGCPVGCLFCGSGGKFIRNLYPSEIVRQVSHILDSKGISVDAASKIKKFQIMFMSMGEPFLNYANVVTAIALLTDMYPNADLLVSTIGPDRKASLVDFIAMSRENNKVGLQFSIHKSTNSERDVLIPFKAKLNLEDIRNYGIDWWHQTGRKVYLNYCVDEGNSTAMDAHRLQMLFPPMSFAFTFSVICSANETMKDAGVRELDKIRRFENFFIRKGYDTRIFDPAGQDDIGGGCGQLWHTQKYMENAACE